MAVRNGKIVDRKPKRHKKQKIIIIGGIEGVEVSSWEEEQEARQQGYKIFYHVEKVKKKKSVPKKKWLSGRVRCGRYDGIFEVK